MNQEEQLIINKKGLDNGSNLLSVVSPKMPFSIVSAWFHAGSRFDPLQKEGMAHLFEHLYLVETEKQSRLNRIKALESAGIAFNAYTTKETAHYYQAQPINQTILSTKLLLDGIKNSNITAEMVENEKAIILDEKERSFRDDEQLLFHLSQKALWPENDLGKDFFGTAQSLKNIDRSGISLYQKMRYCPTNATFIILSDQEHDIEGIINDWTGDTSKKAEKQYKESEKLKPLTIQDRASDSVVVGFNYRLPNSKTIREKVILELIKNYLASGWISRLIMRMRVEKNITYWIRGISEYFSDGGYIRFEYSVSPEKLTDSMCIIEEEIDLLAECTISQNTLDAHKNSYISWLIRYYSDPYNLMWWYGWSQIVQGSTINLHEYIQIVKSVDSEEIRKVAAKYFTNKNKALVIIGDAKNIPL